MTEPLSSTPQPDNALEVQRGIERVQAALDTLDWEHRSVFVLYELEGEPCDAIALVLDIPVGTVHSRLFHARKKFLRAHDKMTGRKPGALLAPISTEEQT